MGGEGLGIYIIIYVARAPSCLSVLFLIAKKWEIFGVLYVFMCSVSWLAVISPSVVSVSKMIFVVRPFMLICTIFRFDFRFWALFFVAWAGLPGFDELSGEPSG